MVFKTAFGIIQKLISTAYAQPPAGITGGVPRPDDWKEENPGPAELVDLEYIFHRIISALFFAGGLIAFIFLLIGGFKYLTSSGDEDALEMARKTITYAVAGLLIIIFSWLFLNTLGEILDLETPILQFTIPSD